MNEASAALSHGLIEAGPDAIIATDTRGTIVLVNAQVERLFGYTRDELIGQSLELLFDEAVPDVDAAIRSVFHGASGALRVVEGMLAAARGTDGTRVTVEINLSAVDTDRGPLLCAAIRDVSKRLDTHDGRERFELSVRQSQRLESLGRLAGGVAHDFNNLIAVILNYAAFVSEALTAATRGPDGQHLERTLQDVEQITRAGERAAHLTRQLLAFARREVARSEVLDLRTVVRGVEQLLGHTLGEDVQIISRLAPDLSHVLADPGQIEQVLVNLAVNARDAMPTGGTLTLLAENTTVEDDHRDRPGFPAGRYVRLCVSDTGEGMDPETLERSFEPFFTTKPAGEGSGLGLATIYGIIAQAGGDVRIRSEQGEGTTVTILLPASDEVATAREEPTTWRARVGGETILVVEDEEAMRDVTRRILTRNGYQVLIASSGLEAFSLLQRHPGEIEVLVTDVVMPGMLGKELAESARSLQPGLRILYMSGYAAPVLASRGTLDAGVALLEKPFSEQQLLKRLEEVLGA